MRKLHGLDYNHRKHRTQENRTTNKLSMGDKVDGGNHADSRKPDGGCKVVNWTVTLYS